MNFAEKAAYLYEESSRFGQAGHTLVAKQLEKMADHFGREFIKESLAYPKGKRMSKKSYIEKPAYETRKHVGLRRKKTGRKKESNALLQNARKAYTYASNNPLLSNMGRGAAMTLGGAAVAAPVASYYINRESDNLMNKVKDYAVPGALAVAGLAAGAFGLGEKSKELKDLRQKNAEVLPRDTVAQVISACRLREKVATAYGSSSEEVSLCDTALSRLLFGAR